MSQENYSLEEICKSWKDLYPQRLKLITVAESVKAAKIEVYLNTFKCLNSEIGIKLVNTIYNKFI